jgi:hypothetical protein
MVVKSINVVQPKERIAKEWAKRIKREKEAEQERQEQERERQGRQEQ